jgi:hypothetical protein
MTTYQFVTTFSVDGYHCYGRAFVDSFTEHSDGHQLVVYHESQPNVDFHRLLTWRNLDHDKDRTKFIQDHGADPKKVGTPRDPNSQAIRFCHKIFAVTDAIRSTAADWVIWVDADVVFTSRITTRRMELACPPGSDLAFLGRVHAPYTECGFVGYRAASSSVRRLADDMRHYYTSGEIFTRPKSDWHDSRCFDICRLRSPIRLDRQHNISAFVPCVHVWPKTVLAEFSRHQKGPRRKQETYGGFVR